MWLVSDFHFADSAKEKGAFELSGAWWLGRFLQQTGSLSGYDDILSTFSELSFVICEASGMHSVYYRERHDHEGFILEYY